MRITFAAAAVAALALTVIVTATAGNGTPINAGSANVLTLAVFGDEPYGINPSDTSQFLATPPFIDSINADPKVDLVVHVGDIHSGKQFCTESYDASIFDLWTQFKDPVVFTPGDNEWSDCHKVAQGGGLYNPTTGAIDFVRDPATGALVDYAGGDPLANLALVRSIFFPVAGQTLGGRNKRVISQAQSFDPAHPSDANYVENVMWEQSRVVFVTVNIPGGSNNDNDVWYKAPVQSDAQRNEIAERTGADIRWLAAAFAQARADEAVGVVVVDQADMWDLDGNPPSHLSQYEPLVRALADGSTTYGGPVLLLNGDSHIYRSDAPLSATDPLNYIHPGYDVQNLHRIVVHGSTTPLEWLQLTIDPRASTTGTNSFGPFSWDRMVQ
jgi:hypothetical protein